MSTSVRDSIANPLADTLVLALSQCRDQAEQVARQGQMIDDLKRENEHLKNALEESRNGSHAGVEAQYKAQFQQVFQQVAEKQLEIDRLREKLRMAKIKARQRRLTDGIPSSPADSSEFCSSSPLNFPRVKFAEQGSGLQKRLLPEDASDPSTGITTASGKRPRSRHSSREPLEDISANLSRSPLRESRNTDNKARIQLQADRVAAAIPEVAEDGDYNPGKKRRSEVKQRGGMLQSAYYRLGDLLESRGPATPTLTRARSSSPLPTGKVNSSPGDISSSTLGLLTPASEPRSKQPRSSLAMSRKAAAVGPEDEEPFRSRPLNRLGLVHFKLNPAANSGLDYAFNQVVRGQERRCLPGCTRPCCATVFNSLANTLPNPLGRDGRPVSDDDLLREYVGPGANDRIRSLTPKARENLIHEAKIKAFADAYGKMHRDVHERGRSPPGFWRTDMPGSQDQRLDREQAKVVEREEVTKRYNEALKEGGLWMFADE